MATRNYRRKSGISIWGSFQPISSYASSDDYICGLKLENKKDRSVTIFAIYLRISHNYYLELEDLEETPLVLRAFESYNKQFGPIEFHGVGNKRILLDHLIRDLSVKKQLILSTSEGRYKVPKRMKRWSPIPLFFKNHLTAVVKPITTTYKDVGIGGTMKFILEIVEKDGSETILPIHPDDYQLKKFTHFSTN